MGKLKKIIPVVLTIYIAFVFIQSLFFKFSGTAAEPLYIFSTLDQWANDAFGISGLFADNGIFSRYSIGGVELVASLLLLVGLFTKFKALHFLGALLSFAIISGAIYFHLFTPLGIEIVGDGGTLFAMAVGVWISSLVLILMRLKSSL